MFQLIKWTSDNNDVLHHFLNDLELFRIVWHALLVIGPTNMLTHSRSAIEFHCFYTDLPIFSIHQTLSITHKGLVCAHGWYDMADLLRTYIYSICLLSSHRSNLLCVEAYMVHSVLFVIELTNSNAHAPKILLFSRYKILCSLQHWEGAYLCKRNKELIVLFWFHVLRLVVT